MALTPLGDVYLQTGQLQLGLDTLGRAEQLCSSAAGGTQRHAHQLYSIYGTRGRLLQAMGRLEAAATTLRTGLSLSERHFGACAAKTALYLDALASTLLHMGALDEGENYLQRAASIYVKLRMQGTIPYTSVLMKTGQALMLRGRLAASLTYLEPCLALFC